MLGAHCSSATLATMPIIQEAGIPMLTGISSSPKITELSGSAATMDVPHQPGRPTT